LETQLEGARRECANGRAKLWRRDDALPLVARVNVRFAARYLVQSLLSVATVPHRQVYLEKAMAEWRANDLQAAIGSTKLALQARNDSRARNHPRGPAASQWDQMPGAHHAGGVV
jgi:hypothetical protein